MLTTADDTKDGGKLAMTPGVRLRTAREGLNKTQQEVAQTLCLKLSIVESIETDSYEHMPSSVFVRGYLRSYAKLLNIDPEEVIELFNRLGLVDKHSGGSSNFRLQLDKTALPTEGRVMRYVTYLVALSLAVLVFLWWNNQRNNSGSITDTAVAEQPMTTADPQTTNAQATSAPNGPQEVTNQNLNQVGQPVNAPVDATANAAANQTATPNVIVVNPNDPQTTSENGVTTIIPSNANPTANAAPSTSNNAQTTPNTVNPAVPNATATPNTIITPSPTTVTPNDPTKTATNASPDANNVSEGESQPKRHRHRDVELAAPFE